MLSSTAVTVVIPCFNEANRMPIEEYRLFFSNNPSNLQYIFVDDGSNDGTFQLIQQLSEQFPDFVQTLGLSENVGKAEAVRAGMQKAFEGSPDYVAYWDADLSTSLNEIELFINFLNSHAQAVLLMGSRVKLHGSTVVIRNEFRHYVGRIVATLISSLLKLAVYDTQCGAKLIKASDAKSVFDRPFISRWLFDVEIIFRILEKYGYKNIEQQVFEVPLSKWVEKGDSKVSWTYFFRLPIDLFGLRITYKKVRTKA